MLVPHRITTTISILNFSLHWRHGQNQTVTIYTCNVCTYADFSKHIITKLKYYLNSVNYNVYCFSLDIYQLAMSDMFKCISIY